MSNLTEDLVQHYRRDFIAKMRKKRPELFPDEKKENVSFQHDPLELQSYFSGSCAPLGSWRVPKPIIDADESVDR